MSNRGRRGQGSIGGATRFFRDKPRLVSYRQKRMEDAIDEELGRKPSSKPKITLPSLGDWGKNAFED